MDKLFAYYGTLIGLFLIAPGYFYVNAYFSFFGMEEVINELGVAYFIQKSSLIWSGIFYILSDYSIGLAYLELGLWLTVSFIFYRQYIKQQSDPVFENDSRLKIKARFLELVSKIKGTVSSANFLWLAAALISVLISALASYGDQFVVYALIIFIFACCGMVTMLSNSKKALCTTIIHHLRATILGFVSMVHRTIKSRPTTLGRTLVALPIVFGVYSVSHKMGGINAWKLVHKELPYYSQIAFPEVANTGGQSTVGNSQYLALTTLRAELKSIKSYFNRVACSQFSNLQAGTVEGIKDNTFYNYERFDFSIFRSHFLGKIGDGDPILLEVYRTDSWVYLTTVMSTLDEEHFTLRIQPDVFGITRTQIKTNTNREARELAFDRKHALAVSCLSLLSVGVAPDSQSN